MWDEGIHIILRNVCVTHIIIMIHAGDSEDRFGSWSTEGCREVMREGNRRVCECTQLAHFGILFVNPVMSVISSSYACYSQSLIHIRT